MEQPAQSAQPAVAQDDMKAWEPPKPEPFKPSHVFGVSKLILGGFNLVFAIITLGLSISFLFLQNYDAYLGIVILIIAAGLSIIWQAAEFLTRLLRRRTHRPVHPGAHVGVHLVLWALCTLCTATLAIGLAYTLDDYTIGSEAEEECAAYYAPEYQYLCDDEYDYDNFATRADASRYFARLEALTAFAGLLTVVHFVLFVLACVETDRRRKYGKKIRQQQQQAAVVYLVPTPGSRSGSGSGPVEGRTYYTAVPAPQAALMLSRGVMETDPNLQGRYVPNGAGAGAGAGAASGSL